MIKNLSRKLHRSSVPIMGARGDIPQVEPKYVAFALSGTDLVHYMSFVCGILPSMDPIDLTPIAVARMCTRMNLLDAVRDVKLAMDRVYGGQIMPIYQSIFTDIHRDIIGIIPLPTDTRAALLAHMFKET